MNLKVEGLINDLDGFIDRFSNINAQHLGGTWVVEDAERVLEDYTRFILNDSYRKNWEEYVDDGQAAISTRIDVVRKESAHCVWTMEKYRANTLLEKGDAPADYFKNVESCIDIEFGNFTIDKDACVLLIGVGAFPMTPMTIARNTGAKVVGIDIDEEAVEYAKKVLNLLGPDLDIQVNTESYRDLAFVKEASHIIIASTIPEKLEILRDLYDLTNDDVVVSMRYGNGFKSLFNYPLLESKQGQWRKADSIDFDDNVFDVVMFKK